MLIDTHCHLDFPEFDADKDVVIERAKKAGVSTIINVGSGLEASLRAVDLASRYENIFATVGIHPHDAKNFQDATLSKIKQLLTDKKVVAIGEVGLDYFRRYSDAKIQIKVFNSFIELASAVRLPLIVHCRDAQEEVLCALSDFQDIKICGVVVHCFSGGIEFLKKCLDLGFFVSFTCNITYPKAQDLRRVVSFVPLDRMFLETDAPFLAPQAKRGKRNEPAFLPELATEVARIKGLDFDTVCLETTKNAVKFFNLPQ